MAVRRLPCDGRSRGLRQWLRARVVAAAAWTYRIRRAAGHRLGRLDSSTH